jgi:hypothetical protein
LLQEPLHPGAMGRHHLVGGMLRPGSRGVAYGAAMSGGVWAFAGGSSVLHAANGRET